MGLFDNNKEREREDWAIIERLLYIIETQAETIRNCCCKKKAHPVKLVYTFSNTKNKKTMPNTSLNVALTFPGPTDLGAPGLLDTTTNQPVTTPPPVFHDASIAFATGSDTTVATVTVDSAANLTIVPLKPGTLTFVVNSLVDFTDSTGTAVTGAPEPSDPITVTVTAAPVADGVKLIYTFSF